jgi:hypothetical protein
MSAFPSLKTGAVLQYPATRGIQHSTCVLRFVDGSEQRFREYPTPMRKWAIRLDLLDEGEMARLEEFFQSQQGRLGNFSFTDPWDNSVHSNCSLESDSLALNYQDIMRGRTALVVRENRD